jgi:hypothetical protein
MPTSLRLIDAPSADAPPDGLAVVTIPAAGDYSLRAWPEGAWPEDAGPDALLIHFPGVGVVSLQPAEFPRLRGEG